MITGALGLVWVALWLCFYESPATASARCPTRSATTSRPGRSSISRATGDGRRSARILHAAQFLGHRAAALSRRSDLGHADLLAAALPDDGAAFRSEADRAVRLAAVPRGRYRLHVRRRRSAWRCRRRGVSSDQRAARRVHDRRAADDGRGASSASSTARTRRSRCSASRGFAHQTLSVTVITMSSDLFKRSEVATVAGMAGHLRQRRRAGVLAADRRAGDARSATRRSSSASACSIWSAPSCCGRSCARAGRRQARSPR